MITIGSLHVSIILLKRIESLIHDTKESRVWKESRVFSWNWIEFWLPLWKQNRQIPDTSGLVLCILLDDKSDAHFLFGGFQFAFYFKFYFEFFSKISTVVHLRLAKHARNDGRDLPQEARREPDEGRVLCSTTTGLTFHRLLQQSMYLNGDRDHDDEHRDSSGSASYDSVHGPAGSGDMFEEDPSFEYFAGWQVQTAPSRASKCRSCYINIESKYDGDFGCRSCYIKIENKYDGLFGFFGLSTDCHTWRSNMNFETCSVRELQI